MNITDVTRLLDAGFTKDEIMSLFPQNPQNNPQETNPEQSEPEPVESSEKIENAAGDHPEKTVDPSGAQPENTNIEKLNATVEKLIRTIQASNLQNNYTGSAGKVDIDKQVDNIMRSIIRPEKKGE